MPLLCSVVALCWVLEAARNPVQELESVCSQAFCRQVLLGILQAQKAMQPQILLSDESLHLSLLGFCLPGEAGGVILGTWHGRRARGD